MLGRCRLNVGLRLVDEFLTVAGRVDMTIIGFNAKLPSESDFGNPQNVGGRFRFTRHDRDFVCCLDLHDRLQSELPLEADEANPVPSGVNADMTFIRPADGDMAHWLVRSVASVVAMEPRCRAQKIACAG
jgi:hypothetical protein